MANLTRLTIQGNSTSLPEITSRIVCSWPAGFFLTNISVLHISALAYTSCGHNKSAAISVLQSEANISHCSFSSHVSADSYVYSRHALYIQNSIAVLTMNEFQYNMANFGGAVSVESSTLTFTMNTFNSNSAQYGGAVYINTSNSIFAGNTFSYNSAAINGGTLYVLDTTLSLKENTFLSNSADIGGALYVDKGILNLTGNKFQSNTAGNDGGALNAKASILSLTGNTFQHSSAGNNGGTLYVFESILGLEGNIFQNNSACKGGGMLFAENSTLNFTGNTLQNNSADVGGALYVDKSTFSLTGNMFQNNSADLFGVFTIYFSIVSLIWNTFQYNSADAGGVLTVESSTLNLTGNIFQTNSAANDGGTLFIFESIFDIKGNIFQNNFAFKDGGVFYAEDSTLNLTGNTFWNNSACQDGGVMYSKDSTLDITANSFHNNSADTGGVIFVDKTTLNLTGNTFWDSSADFGGGALYVVHSTLSLIRNTFQNSSAVMGGALTAELSALHLTGNTFQNNSAAYDGGSLYVDQSTFTLTGNAFHNNCATNGGGVIYADGSSTLNLTLNTIQDNSAGNDGGALYAESSTLSLTGNTFQYNSAGNDGGVLYAEASTLNLTGNTFQYNSAGNDGGAQHVFDSILYFSGNTFLKNYAASGGTLHMRTSAVSFTEDCFIENYAKLGGAIFATSNSILKMYTITIENNRAQYGGAMATLDSAVQMLENTFLRNNRASYGGGLYIHNTYLHGNAIFTNNYGSEGGGGLYASSSTFILMHNTTIITSNSAMDGGGLMLSGDSKLYLQPGIAVHFINNTANSTGGAIKVKENNPLTHCISTEINIDVGKSDCFFQILQPTKPLYSFDELQAIIDSLNVSHTMYFHNNSAIEAGNDLYGGSVENCNLNNFEFSPKFDRSTAISGYVFDVITRSENKPDISSDPLHICTCKDGLTNCTGTYHPAPVYPGGTLEVPVIVRWNTTVVIQVSYISNNISIIHLEYSQSVDNSCKTLQYTIHSLAIGTTQEMLLNAQDPCSRTQTNSLTVTVKILNCPLGFQLSMNKAVCICTERLQHYTDTCLIDNRTVLHDHDFWVGYDNESRGLILHPHCPFHYCTSENIYLRIDDSDKQCNYDRGGLLCGRCSKNLSIALGSSRCLKCSNSYLSLLAAFAFAGVALVLLLLVLRLTVATGTINGLIFYANIVSVNSAIFFKPQSTNVPTASVLRVFIAWLNLDLGIETCFYNGMDAYVKMWMQFAFPLYVWALVGMIIVGSHYSGRVARIFGRNPIAVLATLFLLSYAKLLRTVFAALSYTSLEYPNNSQIAVWLYDGNVRYLSGKHIPLFTAAIVCLMFLFLPYTMLLIISQWLQAKSHLKMFTCINSLYVKPFLDAYHAPYSNKHRYWTGLMLLFRFVLFLISAVNALGDPNVNLLAITSITVVILTQTTLLGSTIYSRWSLGLLETSFIVNLAILAVATLYNHTSGGNQNAVTFTSVGIAFATFTGIVIYHSIQQVKDTKLWRRAFPRQEARVPLIDVCSGHEDPSDYVLMSRSAPTRSVVDMQEL